MIESIRRKGIADEAVLAAMDAVPRHFFLDKAFEEWAYEDKAFPIGNDQTISQPYTVAYQTILLNARKRDKVLEIGTGSGYQAAILATLGARVFTIERQEPLYQSARSLLERMGFSNIRCFYRDGTLGLPEFAPFDRIIVTAGATSVPEELKKQLTTGGMLVIPVGDGGGQRMFRITRLSEQEYKEEIFDDFRFVPLLKGTT